MQGSEPAFPRACFESDHFKDEGADGISTRLYVAAAAMPGLLAHPNGPAGDWGKCAKDALAVADALIAACKEDRTNG